MYSLKLGKQNLKLKSIYTKNGIKANITSKIFATILPLNTSLKQLIGSYNSADTTPINID